MQINERLIFKKKNNTERLDEISATLHSSYTTALLNKAIRKDWQLLSVKYL